MSANNSSYMSNLPDITNPYVIAIYGGTNSGKSTLARIIQEKFKKDIVVISQDSFYKLILF